MKENLNIKDNKHKNQQNTTCIDDHKKKAERP